MDETREFVPGGRSLVRERALTTDLGWKDGVPNSQVPAEE